MLQRIRYVYTCAKKQSLIRGTICTRYNFRKPMRNHVARSKQLQITALDQIVKGTEPVFLYKRRVRTKTPLTSCTNDTVLKKRFSWREVFTNTCLPHARCCMSWYEEAHKNKHSDRRNTCQGVTRWPEYLDRSSCLAALTSFHSHLVVNSFFPNKQQACAFSLTREDARIADLRALQVYIVTFLSSQSSEKHRQS